jgi:putative transposase
MAGQASSSSSGAATDDGTGVRFGWYNETQRTVASGFTPPPTSTTGGPTRSLVARAEVLRAAYVEHPERFVRKVPVPPALPGPAWINGPSEKEVPTQ